jgi:DNA-binding Xre family transcriptional regulator
MRIRTKNDVAKVIENRLQGLQMARKEAATRAGLTVSTVDTIVSYGNTRLHTLMALCEALDLVISIREK